ncbi:MAG: lipase [Prevotellaceae bacterium]|jgi:hypothetical protein|nr:lipase [Prevotellaceae bacterium]
MRLKLLVLPAVLLFAVNAVFSQNDSVHVSEYLTVKRTDSKKWTERFQNDINRYIDDNRKMKDFSCDVLFLGSSSINMWDSIYSDMSPLKVIRRSYGGAAIRDMLYNYNTIARGYKPKSIALYVENDLCNCREDIPEYEIFDLFRVFTQRIRRDYPETPFFIISLKPSFARETVRDKQIIVNRLLRTYAENTSGVYFIDITESMYDGNGNLRQDIFLPDSLHLNRKGYEIWTSIIKPAIAEKTELNCK